MQTVFNPLKKKKRQLGQDVLLMEPPWVDTGFGELGCSR